MSNNFHDAFLNNKNGSMLIVEAQKYENGQRISAIKSAIFNSQFQADYKKHLNGDTNELFDSLKNDPLWIKPVTKIMERIISIKKEIFVRNGKISGRIRQLKSLVFQTFVHDVPEGKRKNFDVFMASKERIKQIGINGGAEYHHAMTAVKYAWTSPDAYKDAITAIK